jgi:hypothetical protein
MANSASSPFLPKALGPIDTGLSVSCANEMGGGT